MSLERSFSPEQKAPPKPHCLFISGGTGTYAGIRGIEKGLEVSYGDRKVDVFNSIFSTDPPNPKRFEQMADVIEDCAKDGLDIIAHSLGAAELKKAIDVVKKRDKAFFENRENTSNIHIVLISPSGFLKGIDGPFRFLSRTIRFSREQADMGALSKSNTLLRGIDALTAFPPDGIPSEELMLALRKAMPELSQYMENQKSFSLVTLTSEEGFTSHLSDLQKGEMKIYGESIRLAIKNRNYEGLRNLVKAYGEKLRKPLAKIHAGSLEPEKKQIEETLLEAKNVFVMIGGYIKLLDTLIKGFGSKTMEEIADLEKKGVKVDLVISEYDIFMRLKEAIAFFNGLSNNTSRKVHLVQGVTHAFPVLRVKGFGEKIKNLN
ncbi:MAG: hypothetical protein HY424_02905 [Candidatus Levybacteria bacterium]|nr:hypothetical protein [Candidatus Levybacteria bacterium]